MKDAYILVQKGVQRTPYTSMAKQLLREKLLLWEMRCIAGEGLE
jgi:hypothetical protein